MNNKIFKIWIAVLSASALIVLLITLFSKTTTSEAPAQTSESVTEASQETSTEISETSVSETSQTGTSQTETSTSETTENTETTETSPYGDASTGGVSIFDVPFGDGYEFPDLSSYDFVFIGDSIFDMNYSPTSMPRQLEVYTGARVYNLSKYSSCAGKGSNGYISFTQIVDVLLSGQTTAYEENQSINIDVARFAADDHSGRKMVIVINHCINDYVFGTVLSNPNDAYDVTTYEGALRTGISNLKNAYPQATIVTMEPYYVGINNQGSDINSRELTMDRYISSLKAVSGEYGALCFDLRTYDFFATYRAGYLLDDLIHPNNMCSKTMARLFSDFVLGNIS